MKIKVHISNRSVFLDPRVAALVEIPTSPRIGEVLYLAEETLAKLEAMAVERPGWKKAYADFVDPKEPDHPKFKSAFRINQVAYFEGNPIVSVELYKYTE